MAQHLADLGQRDAGADHVAGQRVAQPMRAHRRYSGPRPHARCTTNEIPRRLSGAIGATARRNTSRRGLRGRPRRR